MKKALCLLLVIGFVLSMAACTPTPKASLNYLETRRIDLNTSDGAKSFACVFFNFTNESSDTCVPWDVVSIKAYQNGVALQESTLYDLNEIGDAVTCDTSLLAGATATVVWFFELRDESEITIECSNGDSFTVANLIEAPAKELTATAQFEDFTLELHEAEVITTSENKRVLKVSATYTNYSADPYYALSCFGVVAFQNDVELLNLSDINGSEAILIREIKDGQSLPVSYVFELSDDSVVEVFVREPTAEAQAIGRMDYSVG